MANFCFPSCWRLEFALPGCFVDIILINIGSN
ncbi:hypothetical protein Gotur_017925, partial [Gossypium turneri]